MSAEIADAPAVPRTTKRQPEVIYRHSVVVRLTHWINLLCMFVLLLSGLQIFNAHPELYWGRQGFEAMRPFLSIHAAHANGAARGVTTIAGHAFDTTGFLGLSNLHDQPTPRAWPGWLTLPSYQDLSTGRRWHLFFAWILVVNGLVYLAWSLVGPHVRRDLWPTGADVRGIGGSILDHIRLRHPRGEAAKRYNVLQKFAYLVVIFGLAPLMVLTGLTMSPGMDAAWPWLLELFGGRQSARTIHFLTASALVLFVAVHLIEVILAGPLNEMRSMITGRYAVKPEKGR